MGESVGWALPTDHIQTKQKDFKLFDSITSGTLRVGEASAKAEACHKQS